MSTNKEIILTIGVTRNDDGSFTGSISKPGEEYYDGVSDLSEIACVATDMADLVREAIHDAFEGPIEFKRSDS
ncbi:hypothetical protein [Cryobacterium mannosilyticum]|uniref:Uncharacterized protein n=1 Tax=Cryobacterium mannosilyticum TaxID=1259190 RepID=A0A4R8WHB3_9MICO|nr:hypothetical protein [Cryobacterium mannosilyticum]TFC06759.1 hypothetical protein E3O32_03340 [Cryobacterium mannosilyticum]